MGTLGSVRTQQRRAELLWLMNERERRGLPNTVPALAKCQSRPNARVYDDLLALECYDHVFRYGRQWFAYNDDMGVE